ncbi:hypothetical protein [Peribacillus kribbensis]|uniref:hypothetical protein n=1 Tax=Peribacillus kribbensis TaxID=356658 RepID=UPI0003FFB531|nr:hypothetical protein [Peribacillus kribbensis]
MLVVSLPANFVRYFIFIKSTLSFKISNVWQAPLSAFLRGISGTGETPQAKLRRLTARPAESEHPGVEINHHVPKQQTLRKQLFSAMVS